jgi:hypothetical protein
VREELGSVDCQSQICANSLFGEGEEGDSSTSANSCPPPYTYGGNLSVIPSQESPQIYAISSESPRLRGESPPPVWDASDFGK